MREPSPLPQLPGPRDEALPPDLQRARTAWLVLSEVAPELGEWAAFSAATAGKRGAVRAGATAIVTVREADDLIRDAQTFLTLVERSLTRGGRPDRRPPAEPERAADRPAEASA